MPPESTARPALTSLYVPGDRPDRFVKAMASNADEVILDLEDAVAPGHKTEAREAVVAFLQDRQGKPVQVRINGLDTPWGPDDVAAVAAQPGLTGLRVPKVERPEMVHEVARRLPLEGSVAVHLLIETARGVEAAFELATAERVGSIALGEADLRSELNVSDDRGLAWARGRIVVAARAAGLPAPQMSVYPDLADEDGLAASCREGRAFGFLGRAAIHPRQLPIIVEAFLPTDEEVADAVRLLEALDGALEAGQGGFVLPDGRFVDRAMAGRAKAVVALGSRARSG
jgi:citrate lyase subunit beta / citryl-CoA lyase